MIAPEEDMTEPLVIAATSRTKAVMGMVIYLLLWLPVLYLWYLALNDWDHYLSSPFRRWALPTMTLIYLSTLPLFIKGLRQIFRHGRRIVWIEKDQLVYYDPSHFSVPCKDIATLLPVAGFMGRDAIAVVARDGSRKEFAAFGMSISRDEIMKRLREICGLPEPAPEQAPKD
jgi:hypothetical protein